MAKGAKLGKEVWGAHLDTVVALCRAGKSPAAIGREVGISAQSIRKKLMAVGIYEGKGAGGYQRIDLPESVVHEVVSRYMGGERFSALSREFRVTPVTMLKNVKRFHAGFKVQKTGSQPFRGPERLEELRRLYFDEVKSADKCAEHFGVSVMAVRKAFECAGWSFRNNAKTATLVRDLKAHSQGREDFREFCRKVRNLSRTVYWAYVEIIDPDHLKRKGGHHVDHILSLSEGYSLGVPWHDLAHPANLRVISAFENQSKGMFSMHSPESLGSAIAGFEEKYGAVDFPRITSAIPVLPRKRV